ncbi:hypothetical protein [Kitasatospora sp. NPDC057738]|uniref:hypothetical protein n=1 Tax=Kitasatospora sp. NPDC057738 TaxID=3346233 RepID=UPI00368BAC86
MDQPDFNPRTHQLFWMLLDEIKPAQNRYQRALRRAHSTATDSPENLAARAKGNTALAEMEMAIREWVAATACTCGRIAIGLEVTDHREWHRDCRQHGVYSTWWNSPEQQAARETRRQSSIDLQARARDARLAAGGAR